MRLSKKGKLLFIHIAKNAGRSVWEAMEKKYKDTRKIAWGHSTLQEVHKKINLKKYTTFAIVRNPYDRMVSLYHFLYQQKDSFMGYDGVERPTSIIPGLGFEKWLLEYGKVAHTSSKKNRLVTSKQPQLDWLTVNKKVVCNEIIRFEELYPRLHNILGITKEELPVKHKTKRGGYRELYTPKSKAFVEKYFKKDLEYFNYEF